MGDRARILLGATRSVAAVFLLLGSSASGSPDIPKDGSVEINVGEINVAPPVERLTLAEALSRAFSQNPDAVVAAYEIEKSEGQLRQAQAAEWPTLVGNGTFTRLDHDRVIRSSGAGGTSGAGTRIGAADQWSANLLLTVPILVPTAWAGVHRATSARNLAKATVADVRRELAAAVARAYLGIVLHRRQSQVAARARDTARAHFDFARARLLGGIGTSLDDVRAEQELRSDEVQVAAAQAAMSRAQAALATVLSADHPVDVVDEVPLAAPPSAATAPDEARRNRSDLKILESRLRAAQHSRHDVWTLYSPFLTANGQGFVQDTGSVLQPRAGWQAQLVLTLPFYDGGIRGGVAKERAANESEIRVQLEAAIRDLAVEVRTAFEIVMRSDEGLNAARQAARLAGKAAELADLAYRAGATTNLEVIDAERRARDAETQAALAEDAARQARLDLLLVTGRFP
jgi:outer membrane protein